MGNANLSQSARRLASSGTQPRVYGKPWQKGQSGNPGGKPKARENIVEMARSATPKAMRTMIDIMGDDKAPYSVRAYCADKVIDRAYGKPAQQTNLNINTNMRSLRELSDAELMSIIEGQRAPKALSAPPDTVLEQPTVDVEPEMQPDILQSDQ